MGKLQELYEPKHIMGFFEDICAIPHGSGTEAALRDYIRGVAEANGHETWQDEKGNLMVTVAASPGCEKVAPFMLQGHMDMVWAKKEGSTHNFETDPIELVFEPNGIVRANDTTLGADNAVALVNMLALMVDDSVTHPKLELLFTVEEETGLWGVRALDFGRIQSRRMLNMDCGDHETICLSCAGVVNTDVALPIKRVPAVGDGYTLKLQGLTGGHAGLRIGLGRASAISLLGRLLCRLYGEGLSPALISVNRAPIHSIADEVTAVLALAGGEAERATQLAGEVFAEMKAEYADTDPDMEMVFEKMAGAPAKAMDDTSGRALAKLMYLMPQGTIKRDLHQPEIILASNNMEGIVTADDEVTITVGPRSSVDAYKWDLFRKISLLSELCGAKVVITDQLPGWPYHGDTPLHTLAKRVFEERFGRPAKIEHANSCAEPSILVEGIPGMEVVGFAPYSHGAHTPDEYMDTKTFLPFWQYLTALLKAMCQAG